MEPLTNAYNPAAAAARWSAAWVEADLFRADPSQPGDPFSIVIPPPNVTGSLHMGHALNNTLQDVLIRYKRMDGYNVLWVPGTDHAGIATQWVVRRQLEAKGIDYRTLGRDGFVERVWSWKAESGSIIVGQLQRLGVSCDWSRERFTLDPALTTAVTEHFVKLYEDGLIYRGERLVNWDPADQTAVSDLEVVHEEGHVTELFSFAYAIADSDGGGEIVVATTRPETMLGDTAVAVHPQDPRYQHLIGRSVQHPFLDRRIPIIADAILVDPEFGSGAVKVTPAHDFNDFEVGKRHGLPMINLLNGNGTLNDACGQFTGLSVADARVAVKAALDTLGMTRGTVRHVMALGRSQRSGAVIEPMLSTQWFVKMKSLSTPALAAVKNGFTRFVPQQWENTYFAWLKDVRDWTISRQLWWGHRIPAWTCDACQTIHVLREAPTACPGCGHGSLTQDPDVLDTWFSSALWPFSVFGWPEPTADLAKWYPTSVLVTGFDIIFFWVARMMFAGLHLTGSVPFRDVYIHALVRDEHGEKMSKTKGNVVDPLSVIDRVGADAFRFTLVALSAQGRDVLWNEKRVEGAQRFSTKLWSALRFCRMNLEGYDASAPMDPGPYERWLSVRTGEAVGRVRDALDNYRFNEAAAEIHSFAWGELCDWYIEFSKAGLYDAATPPARRNAIQHALVGGLGAVARLVHPLMPFLSEEIAASLPGATGFVATSRYPRAGDYPSDAAALEEIASLQASVIEVRRIRSDMELSPRAPFRLLVADPDVYDLLCRHSAFLADNASCSVEMRVGNPVGVATAVVRGAEIVIPLEGLVDFHAEVDRLHKALAKIEKDIAGLTARLAIPGFADNAPADVVEEFVGKLAAARQRQTALTASRDRLAQALA